MKQMKNNILFEVPNFFSEKECRYSAPRPARELDTLRELTLLMQ